MLTVDLGNSRLKARLWERAAEREPICRARWDGALEELEQFERWLAGASVRRAALASVASAAVTARVEQALARAAEHVWSAPAPELENACRAPERVGADRLYAAAGALALARRSWIVVDAGTALPVDALRGEGEPPVFLGGAIAPGPALLAGALARHTARLPHVAPRPGARALGRITEEAIEAGIVVGFRGAAAELVEAVAREAGLGAAAVALTGGAREFLLGPAPFTLRELVVEPELVHRGLLAALERAAETR
jgi:type III pantothenate kinase